MKFSTNFLIGSAAMLSTVSSYGLSTNNATYANWMDPTNVAPDAFSPELCPGGIRITKDDLPITAVAPPPTIFTYFPEPNPTYFTTEGVNCTVALLPFGVQAQPPFAAEHNRYAELFFATDCDFKFMVVKATYADQVQTAAQVIDLTKDDDVKLSQELLSPTLPGFSVKSLRADAIDPSLYYYFEYNFIDFCPTADGVYCGEIDTDGDGVYDLCDTCPANANADTQKSDVDGDLVADACDNCESVANSDQSDVDSDQIGDVCDNCPNRRNKKQRDTDEDGVGNKCDNCKRVANPEQEDGDDDHVGDVCDNCVEEFNPRQRDRNHNGVGDVCDARGGRPRHRGFRRRGRRGGNDDDDEEEGTTEYPTPAPTTAV